MENSFKKPNYPISAALGTFDGMHIAHREVLRSALQEGVGICITFSYPPSRRGMLLSAAVKEKRLSQMGFERVVMLDFERVKDMSPIEFLQGITEEYGITRFCCGYDYRFGKNAEGDIKLLASFCEKKGLELSVTPRVLNGGEVVSSTAIRNYLKDGELEKAISLLGDYPYFESEVVRGDARGRTIGFPTINQALPEGAVQPRFGVYETELEIEGKAYRGITNFGLRPTFLQATPSFETYIIGFEGDLYGKLLGLKLKRFIREERKFNSLEELKAQLSEDMKELNSK